MCQVEEDQKARDQIDRVFRKLDLNQDGVITLEEFMESCLKVKLKSNCSCMHLFVLVFRPQAHG